MRGCHERESGQEKVVRHQLCKAQMWEQSPREKGGARPARARESEREGARGPRERKSKRGRKADGREKEWDQSPRCRTRRVSVTERRP